MGLGWVGAVMMIRLDNLTLGYDRHPAVHHLSGTFAPASMTAIIGPNGGGKSTLLKAITGMVRPLSGRVMRTDQEKIGYLPQVSAIDRTFPMTVLDTVLLGFWRQKSFWRGMGRDCRDGALAALERVGMASFAHRPVAALSTGQFQRVLFARLMVQDAAVILLDEPFNAVDARTTRDLLAVVMAWHAAGKTILAVLHEMDQVRNYFPQALLLAREMVAWGDTCDVVCEAHLARADMLARQWHDRGAVCQIEDEESTA